MLNATLEYNTSLAGMQHVKWEGDSTKKFTKTTGPYRSVVEKVTRGKDAYLPCTRNVFCFWDEKEDYNALSWVRHDGRLWSAFKRVWKQLKSVSRVAELSFAERLQGS